MLHVDGLHTIFSQLRSTTQRRTYSTKMQFLTPPEPEIQAMQIMTAAERQGAEHVCLPVHSSAQRHAMAPSLLPPKLPVIFSFWLEYRASLYDMELLSLVALAAIHPCGGHN